MSDIENPFRVEEEDEMDKASHNDDVVVPGSLAFEPAGEDEGGDDDDMTGLISSNKPTSTACEKATRRSDASSPSFCCSLDIFRQFFDVDTIDVKNRLLVVVNPCSSKSFLEITRDSPDLYGPFWIATTLIFSIGISSSIEKASIALSIVYGFITIFSLGLYVLLRYLGIRDERGDLHLSSLLCLNGYAFVVFLPFVALCSLPGGSSLRLGWLFIASVLMSGVIVRDLWPLAGGKIPVVAGSVVAAIGVFGLVSWLVFYN